MRILTPSFRAQARSWIAITALKAARAAATTLATAYRARFNEHTKLALVLQAVVRSKLARARVGRMARAASVVVNVARGLLARLRLRSALRAALTLQRCVRGHRVRRPHMLATTFKKMAEQGEEMKRLEDKHGEEMERVKAELAALQKKLEDERTLSAAFVSAVAVVVEDPDKVRKAVVATPLSHNQQGGFLEKITNLFFKKTGLSVDTARGAVHIKQAITTAIASESNVPLKVGPITADICARVRGQGVAGASYTHFTRTYHTQPGALRGPNRPSRGLDGRVHHAVPEARRVPRVHDGDAWKQGGGLPLP